MKAKKKVNVWKQRYVKSLEENLEEAKRIRKLAQEWEYKVYTTLKQVLDQRIDASLVRREAA